MSNVVTVGLVGIGGYGTGYANRLLDDGPARGVRLIATVDPYPEGYHRLADVHARNIPVYATLRELYRHHCPDLMVIASPIQFHREQACFSLSHGSSVLCEKPVAATIQDALAMEAASAKAGRFVAIGYQWSFSPPVQALKQDIMAGRLGRPRRLKTLVNWPRPSAYYQRNGWAGARRDNRGRWVLDSPVSNATAHYLHNMLYVLGDAREKAVQPASVEAELYRINPITNFDTAFLRCKTVAGTEVLFCTSHAVPSVVGPVLCYTFDDAIVTLADGTGSGLCARFHDGTVKAYGDPNADTYRKLWDCAESVRSGSPVACDVRSAIPHLLCVNGAQESMPQIGVFPDAMRREQCIAVDNTLTWVDGLQAAMIQCYDTGMLPHEANVLAWARTGKEVDLTDYRSYPS